MAKMAIYGHEPHEMVQDTYNHQVYNCGSGEAFQFVTLLNQSTKKKNSWNLTLTEFSGMYPMYRVYCQIHTNFASTIQSVLVTEAEGNIVQEKNAKK